MPDPGRRRRMDLADAAAFETALLDLSAALAIPDAAAARGVLDPAIRARLRIESGDRPRTAAHGWWRLLIPGFGAFPRVARPLWRGSVLALVALIVVVAVAGAIGLGLPGIRIVPAPTGSPASTPAGPSGSQPGKSASSTPLPSPRPTPTVGPPGFTLGLGDPITIADAVSSAGFPVVLPHDGRVGGPTAAWLLDNRLTFVWPTGPSLPSTEAPGIGLLLSEFRGSIDPGYFEKIIGPETTLTTVAVGDVTGYWISGAPHEIVYVDENGHPSFDSRRSVGDTLLWARGDVTYRLESGLGRAATIELAATMR